jgi:hypothetical protein
MAGPFLTGGRYNLEELPTDRRLMYALTLGLVAVGLSAFAYGLIGWADAFEVRRWLEVPGEVIESHRELAHARTAGRSSSRYHVFVHYTYRVGGQLRHGHRIDAASEYVEPAGQAPHHVFSGGEEADELVRRYRAGRDVSVFYDPEDPGRAVLTKGLRYWHDLALWMGLPLAILGFILFRWLRRTEAPDEEPARDTLNAD